MMKSKHVINILESFCKFDALRCACLIHHLVVFLICSESIVSESIGASLLSNNHDSLSVLGHYMLFESISFLFIVNVFQLLQQDSQWISLSEIFTLEESCLTEKIGLKNFRVLSYITIEMLSHDSVDLPER